MISEKSNRSRTGSERRQMDAKDIKAIIEIFSKPFLFDRLIDIFVCGSDNADIHVDVLYTPNSTDDLLLQNSKKARLGLIIHGADLVEEDRPAVGLLKKTRSRVKGTSVRALFVTE